MRLYNRAMQAHLAMPYYECCVLVSDHVHSLEYGYLACSVCDDVSYVVLHPLPVIRPSGVNKEEWYSIVYVTRVAQAGGVQAYKELVQLAHEHRKIV